MRLIIGSGSAELDARSAESGRTISGELVPYGKPGKTSRGRVTVRRGVIALPDDLARVKLVSEHDRAVSVGYLDAAEETDTGLRGSFRVASTPAGELAHLEARERVRDGLSVELDDVELSSSGELLAGRLVAVSLVSVPAFDDARAVAAARPLHDPPSAPDPEPEPEPEPAPVEPDEPTKPKRKPKRSRPEGEPMTDTTERVDELDTATDTDSELVTAARVPAGLRAARTEPRPASPGDTLTAAMDAIAAAVARPGDPELMAALSDVTYTGAAGAAPPQWLGQLWQGDRAPRRYIDAISRGRLVNGKALAWDWSTPPAGGDYNGDKAAIPSNTPAIQAHTVDASRWAGGHDIDRAIFDFQMSEYLQSYSELMVDDYRKTTETAAVAHAVSVANANTTAATAAAGIVQASVAIAAVGGVADTIFLSADVVEALAALGSDALPGIFANFTLDDWLSRIHPDVPAGAMLLQDRRAVTFHELSDPPVRVDALQLAMGGVDRAFFGYYALTDSNPGAVQLVTPVAFA